MAQLGSGRARGELAHEELPQGNWLHWEMAQLGIGRFGNWLNWGLSQLELAQLGIGHIGNCPNWAHVEIGHIGNCSNWGMAQLGTGPIGDWLHGELPQLGIVPIGLRNWPYWELSHLGIGHIGKWLHWDSSRPDWEVAHLGIGWFMACPHSSVALKFKISNPIRV